MSRSRLPGNVRRQGLGRDEDRLTDWTRINVADGTWTKNDPDSHVTNISNTGGINSVDIDGTSNSNYINGCAFFREIRLVNGGPFDFTDRPVDLRGYVHLSGTGWKDDGSQTGGGDKPPIASKSYCILGFYGIGQSAP